MAFGPTTFSGLSTAVSDIGAGISAEGAATSDMFAAEAEQYKIEGTQFEKASYREAAALAGQNEQFTAISTRIKAAQQQRELSMSLGTTQANVAGAGLAESGSALDVLRESASQGALTRAVIKSQGLITEAGYNEQQQSYLNMVQALTLQSRAILSRGKPTLRRRARQTRRPPLTSSVPALPARHRWPAWRRRQPEAIPKRCKFTNCEVRK
jgi:hypothetical protein